MNLRPSNLPKLAECACYESDPNAGEAAARGSALDALFRAMIAGTPEQSEIFYRPNAEDWAAVKWAVEMVRTLATSNRVLTREEDCRVAIPGFENEGTADCIIPRQFTHCDLKTGQIRNYLEQMAAYALGLMGEHFASEWTAHLLFCDQRQIVSYHFTFEEAEEIVGTVVARYNAPDKQPTLCEYCGWCAKANTCPARTQVATVALSTVTDPAIDFELILADNEKLGAFLTGCSVLEDFQKKAKAVAKERLFSGLDVPGWKLQTRKSPDFVNSDEVGRWIQKLGFGAVLAAYGNLSGKDFRAIWEAKVPSTAMPPGIIQPGKAISALVPVKLKKAA